MVMSNSCLTNLPLVICKTGVNCRTGSANLCAKGLCKVEDKFEVLLAANTVAAGYDYLGTLYIYLSLLNLAADNLYRKICICKNLLYIHSLYRTLGRRSKRLLLHNALANGCHLRSVVWVNNGCNDVSAKC